MKTKIGLILLLFIGFSTHAQTAETLFSKGNNAYQKGQYENAIQFYETIENQDLVSADLFFNLGNCYYRLNKIAPSVYYYEKALKLNPNHEDALYNLEFAKRMRIDVIQELPKTFYQRFSENVIQKLTFNNWAILAVVFSFLTSFLFLIYYFSSSSRKKLLYFNLSILTFLIMGISLFFAASNYKTVQKNRSAIIFAKKCEIKNSPSLEGSKVFELHEGAKVYILDELSHWRKIKLADGKIGWINAENLKEI